jgi:RimJ/RimL family protein N-acetyltransferase
MKSVLAARYPFLVVARSSEIMGWCDVGPREHEGFEHAATLGMGLRAQIRGRGLGSRLLKQAIARSCRRGIEKLELRVYASNRVARRLYEKSGFKTEGRLVRARKLDGRYDDIVLMALFLTPDKAAKGTRRKRRLSV